MAMIPKEVIEGWENREGAAVFTTVDENSIPNSVYVGCIQKESDSSFVITDNYFDKTRSNINNKNRTSILFITKDRKSFQLKGTVDRQTSGEIFDNMKKWVNPKLPCHAAVIFNVEEIYKGSERLV